MRAFVAVDLPEDLLDALEDMQAGLPERLVMRENLHVTLAFLGDVAEPVLRDLHDRLALLQLQAPVLRVTGLDMFGGRKPNLVVATLASDTALEALRDTVRRTARDAGIELHRERFRPHVTLVRLGRKVTAREEAVLAGRLGMREVPGATANSFSLCHSELRPEGPRYSMLAQYAF